MIGTFTQAPIANYWPEGRCKAQFNSLHKEGCTTLGDLLAKTEAEIMRVPLVGRKTLYLLRQILADGMRGYLEEVS